MGEVVDVVVEVIPANFIRLNDKYHNVIVRIQGKMFSQDSIQKVK
jgi:hypothetical protein